MTFQKFGIAALALLGRVSADSCCFVVQDEAHEAYWPETAAETYTSTVYLTSITILVTPYPATTITNYETNVYPTEQVFTKNFVVTENPVALYTNAVNAIAQQTEILDGPSTIVTGGVTMVSPTGFWVYHTARIFTAPAVTDAVGNVACGTISSFTSVATGPPACVPTFTGVNSNAAAYFQGAAMSGVDITLTTPFVHVPTRAALPSVGASQVCAQGNGTQNYGYPVQELISHLAANPFYASQYPGIENCIPAGPQIHAVADLVQDVPATTGSPALVSVGSDPPSSSVAPGSDPPPSSAAAGSDPPSSSAAPGSDPPSSSAAAGTTSASSASTSVESPIPSGNLTSSTTMTVTGTGTNTTGPATSPPVTSSPPSSPGSASPTSITSSSSSSSPTALPESSSSNSTSSSVGESPVASGGLLPSTSSSTSISTSSSSPVTTNSSSTSVSTSSSSPVSTGTTKAGSSSASSRNSIPTALPDLSSSSSSSSSETSSAAPTSAASSSTEPLVGGSTIIPVGTTAPTAAASSSSGVLTSPSALTSNPGSSIIPVTISFSAKQYVPWKLLASVLGVMAFAFH